MATSIPLTFRAAPFPEGYKADPEQLKNDIVARLYAESSESISFFASGSVAPSSNVGPWLKNGVTWYVWSNGLAMYVPQVMEPESLGYIAQVAAPDPAIYTFWIELNGSGKAIAIKYYSTGAWRDIYEDNLALYLKITDAAATYLTIADAAADYQPLNANLTTITTSTLGDIIYSSASNTLSKLAGNTTASKRFLTQTGNGSVSAAPAWTAIVAGDIPDISATYLTVATAASTYAPLASPALTGNPTAPTQSPGNNSTRLANTAFVTAAIAAIPTPSEFAAYPAQGVVNNQTVPIDGAATFTQLEFDNATINPAPAPFNTTTFRYIAQANGSYQVSVSCQCDNDGGVPAMMSVQASLYKNGVFVGNLMADIDNTPSPNGDRWSPGFGGLVELVTTDYLEVFMSAEDGTNAGDLTVSAQISVHRVSTLS